MKVVFFVFLAILIISCQKNQDKSIPSGERVFDAERTTFFNSLKNPEEVAKLAANLPGFEGALLNDPKNYYLYGTSEVMAAANLGVYLADLNYCILFKKSDEAKQYFEAVYELSKIIKVEKSTLEFLIKRYETNIAQNDSVKLIVGQLLTQSTAGLQGTDRERLAGVAIAAYQIENLYLALSTLSSFPENPTPEQIQAQNSLINFVVEQRGKFEIVYNFIRVNSDPLDPDRNPNYPFFDNALRELVGVYQSTDKANLKLKELGEKVNAIRSKIVTT
ncbi:MAG: hypothetical protein ABL895_15540 [Cyclobacteriaceae bacterium]